jgi:hypothetical protein
MNHQPYEDLLLDDAPLTPGEKEMLSQHLAVCPQCARLEQSLRALDHEFKVAPAVSPAVGFTSRWQASLPARRKKHEREQTRIILISMASTVVATSITLAAFLLPDISPITVFVNLFTDLIKLVDAIAQFWKFVASFFNAIPTSLTIGILAIISFWLSLTLLAWGITFYRITLKGLRSIE